MITLLLILLLSYLIGGIPFSFLVAKVFKGVDLRQVGSGNVGATNACRLFPKPWTLIAFLVCFSLDAAKGFLPAHYLSTLPQLAHGPLAGLTSGERILLVGCAAIIGHIYTPYLGFKGGKGVATSLGVFLAAAPLAVLITVIIGIAVILITRYVSVGSIVMAVVLPILVYFRAPDEKFLLALTILVGLFIIVKHRTNIQRLLKGRESKLFTKNTG